MHQYWNSRRALLRAMPLAAALGACIGANAQMIDDVELRSEGAKAVVAVHFAAPVRYLRSVSASSHDLVQALYEVVPSRDTVTPIDGQRKTLRGGSGMPTVTVTDESDTGLGRKLIVRFDASSRFTVRAGKTNRIIEIVLEGLGEAARLNAERAPQAHAAPAARYQIVLQRGPSPIGMEKPLPRALADVDLRNTARVVQGKTEYELTISPFNTMADARAALTHLSDFPAAAISEIPGTDADVALAVGAGVPQAPADQDARGRDLLDQATAAQARGDDLAAAAALEELLTLPPTASSRAAQVLIGEIRQRMGDLGRARAEYETFLKLYPEGDDSLRVRALLAALPAASATARAERSKPTAVGAWTGSWSQTYYGGQSQTQTLLKDTPLEGQIPQVVSDSTISGTDQKLLLSSVDLGYRYRDADKDVRFVFREALTTDMMPNRPDKKRVSALYVDYKLIPQGLSARLGRQSGLGGGVLGRFDGALLGWAFRPKWKLNAVAGVPTDSLLDTKRHFYGVSVDADALLPQVGGSLYAIQQVIDGQIDRRALGNELRYVKPNATVFSVLEYDLAFKGVNIASAQGLFMTEGNTSINLMADRRSTPMLMLGNALFFPSPDGTMARRITDLLGLQSLDAMRHYVSSTTAYMTQASASVTTPVSSHWQAGVDVRLVNVGALAPVVDIPELVNGRPGTGNLWTAGLQAIGSNLYSQRDTHVLMVSAVAGPSLTGWLASYNNLSAPWPLWQIEPSLRLYQQSQQIPVGTVRTSRVTPGLRVSYKLSQHWSLESDLSVEFSRTRGPTQDETSHRVFYALGYRYDY